MEANGIDDIAALAVASLGTVKEQSQLFEVLGGLVMGRLVFH